MKVYLAGPITGLTYDGAVGWREEIQSILDPEILTLSPMRGKNYLMHKLTIEDNYDEHVLSTEKAINTRDFNDVLRCDAVFVNFLGAKTVSIGTVMEIAWAKAFNKPVVCVMEKDNIHNHSMLNYACGFIVENFELGVAVLESLLLGDNKIKHYGKSRVEV